MATISAIVRWADNTADLTRNLREGVNQIEATRASVDRMVQSLNGDKLVAAAHRTVAAIQEVGGAATLTASQAQRSFGLINDAIEKLERTGKTVPESMRAMRTELESVAQPTQAWADKLGNVKTIVQGLISLKITQWAVEGMEASLEYAKSLTTLSQQTGIGVEGLQRLEAIGAASGKSLDSLTNAVSVLEKRIGSGEASKGFDDLGVSLYEIRKQSPDQMLITIVEALNRIEDPAHRAAVAAELFGKGFKDIAGLPKDLQAIADATTVMSDKQIADLAKAAHAWDELTLAAKRYRNEMALFVLNPEHQGPTPAMIAQQAATLKQLAIAGGAMPDLPTAPQGTPLGSLFMHMQAPDDLGKVQLFGQELDDQIESTKKAIAADEAFKKIQDALFGRDLIANADEFLKALGGVQNITQLTGESAKKLHDNLGKALDVYKAIGTAGAPGLLVPGNIDLMHRPNVKNADGSISTVRSMSFEEDGAEVLVPTVIGNKVVSNDEAIQHYKETGEHLGKFAGEAFATAYAQKLHESQAKILELQQAFDAASAQIISQSLKTFANPMVRFGPGFVPPKTFVIPPLDGVFGPNGAVNNPQGGLFPAAGPASVVAAAAANIRAATNTSIFSGLGTAVPQSIVAALQGGGSVVQAAVGTMGMGIGTNLVKNFGTAITNNLGKTFGGAINAILPGLGALAAPLVNFIGKLFGKSEESSKVSPVRDEFFKMQGGLEKLNPLVQALSGNLNLVDAVFKAKTVDQYNTALAHLNAILEVGRKDWADAKGTYDGVAERLRTITTLTPGVQSALDAAMNATNAKDLHSALVGINDELDKQAKHNSDLQGALDRYGIKASDTTDVPFKTDIINRGALDLSSSFDILSKAGVPLEIVLSKMAPDLSSFANQAKLMGVEVPNSMRPILEAAIKHHDLLDANGKEITDLGSLGLTFGDTMETVMKVTIPNALDRLNTVLDGLAKFLGIDLPAAAKTGADGIQDHLDDITPPDLTVHVGAIYDGFKNSPDFNGQTQVLDGAASGGLVTDIGIQHFAMGGRVLRFMPQGTDTQPAMLTPGEVVLNAAQQKNVAGEMGGGTTVVNHYHINAIDVQSFRDAMKKPGGGADILIEDLGRGNQGRDEKMRRALRQKRTA